MMKTVGTEQRSMYDRLLLAVDGSEEARHAARRGLELAGRFDADVDVLHVVPQKALRLTLSGDEKTQLRERGQTALAAVENDASNREFGQQLTTSLREGTPPAEISEHAAEQDADLIVLGRQGATGLKKKLLGGVTEQVLHRADCPVFVVPDEEQSTETDSTYSDILIPTDGSENAEAATPHGIAIAASYGSMVHVLNVVDLQDAGGMFSAGGLNVEFVERLEASGGEAVERVADEIVTADPDLAVKTAVERTASFDGVVAGIGEYVSKTDVDLVVMGSHGRSNLKRQLLGSVAASVLREVDVPILVVDRPQRQQDQ
jgi:nucleotide-binding universal stress UspA family protein